MRTPVRPGATRNIRRIARLLAAVAVMLTFTPSPVAAEQGTKGAAERKEVARLDALLASGDSAGADRLLASLAPELARDDRLALDTIYVLIRRGRIPDARRQWNLLAPRLQERLRQGGERGGSPPDPDARRRLGEALFTQALLVARDGEKAEAVKLLQQADGYGFPPLDSPLMLMAADCLRDLQEYSLAANAYRAFLERAPANASARMGLATSLYAARKFDAARTELEILLRRAPATPRANYLLGAVLVDLNRYEDARKHLERELSLDPRCVACLSRLAHVAYLEGNDRECRSLLARATTLDPADVETQMVSGLLAFRAGHYDAAIGHLARVVERSPDYAAARYQLAMAYRRAGRADQAREQFEAYQRLLQEQKARENSFRGQQ